MTESDECGFGKVIVVSPVAAEDVMGERHHRIHSQSGGSCLIIIGWVVRYKMVKTRAEHVGASVKNHSIIRQKDKGMFNTLLRKRRRNNVSQAKVERRAGKASWRQTSKWKNESDGEERAWGWEEKVKRQKNGTGEKQASRMMMSVMMQSWASFPIGTTTSKLGSGTSLSWYPKRRWLKDSRVKRGSFVYRVYWRSDTVDVLLFWWRWKWGRWEGGIRCGRSSTLLELRIEEVLQILSVIKLMATAAREWEADLGLIACSTDVTQAFDNILPESLSLVMKEMYRAPLLGGAILREQIGGIFDILLPGNKGQWDTLWWVNQTMWERMPIFVQHDEWRLQTTAGKAVGRKDGSQDEDWWKAARRIQRVIWSLLTTTVCLLLPKKSSGRWWRRPLKNWGKEVLTWKKTKWKLMARVFLWGKFGDVRLEGDEKEVKN